MYKGKLIFICVLVVTISLVMAYNFSVAGSSKSGQTENIVTNSLGMQFVHVPPGSFLRGSPSDETGRTNDEKQQKVTLTNGYFVQTTEVTQKQW